MKASTHRFLWILWAAVLAGCGGMLASDQPPEHVYWLEAADLQLGEAPTNVRPDLIVAVDAIPGLDTDRILVREPGARMNHYAGARWPDYLPEVMGAIMRLSLESSGRFDHVGSGPRTGDDEWMLEVELRKFFAVAARAAGPPEAHVELAGHLDCGFGDHMVSATATTRARENRLTEIVAAFQAATDDAMLSLGRKLAASCFPAEGQDDNR